MLATESGITMIRTLSSSLTSRSIPLLRLPSRKNGSLSFLMATTQRARASRTSASLNFFVSRCCFATKIPIDKVIDVTPPPPSSSDSKKQHPASSHPKKEDATTTAVKCWNCNIVENSTSAFSCHSCKVLLDKIGPGDYFQIFSIPRSFFVDLKALDKKYIQLQRQLHPDNFVKKSKREQTLSGNHSALLNEAYQTLKDPNKRVQYLLSLEGFIVGEAAPTITDVDLLDEIMTLREEIEEAQGNAKRLQEIYDKNLERLKVLNKEIGDAFQEKDIQKVISLSKELAYLAKIEDDVRQQLPVT
eukprot:TRINITY_DN10101_c0_g1_i1.p1 TRINITY_DN10101_c0_g1~~TRINITY_DN10101_c0_g1_i1.p1  ORF type:complete len:312 (-),score=85.27 TRINITY_DN10101_c0_g1_i1:16-921(-)